MPINTVIREKRKAIGLTQEQIAEYMGVSTPAVNKWERGVTYPDVSLLPALARLLKTDLNTLLGFNEGLSRQEIQYFSKEVVETIQREGFESGFRMAIGKVLEYPNNPELMHSTAMLLDGALLMSRMDAEDKQEYENQIISLYERAAKSDDDQIRSRAAYMLASRYTRQERYDKAQEMLDLVPERSALDKRKLRADFLIKQGKLEEGAVLLEGKLLTAVNEIQIGLASLADVAAKEGKPQDAADIAKLAQKFVKLFELWDYCSHVVPLTVAIGKEDVSESISALKSTLSALFTPWDMGKTLLYRHIPSKELNESFGNKVLPGLLSELENGPRYEFLRSNPEFQQLLEQYRERL